MEHDKFLQLVDELLEPQIKSLTETRYNHSDHIYKESSIKLGPRGLLQPCGDCGLLVKNRVVQYAVYDLARNPHWKKKCLECGQKTRICNPVRNA